MAAQTSGNLDLTPRSRTGIQSISLSRPLKRGRAPLVERRGSWSTAMEREDVG
jgi:hypothetical protein